VGAHVSVQLLEVDGLRVTVDAGTERVTPVDGVSLSLSRGESLGIVGESGSGKSLTLRAILGLLPATATVEGTIRFDGLACQPSPGRAQSFTGHGAAMVFQEPMTAMNPTMRVGDLVGEGVRQTGLRGSRARDAVVQLLRDVGMPDPVRRARAWPHQLSGGLRQRAMIAAAPSTSPDLLLCDEPTTALDVTVQDQILGLLTRLRHERDMAMLFVTHDLAVVAEVCDRIAVMYAGQIVEHGRTDVILGHPQHPYTMALVAAAPTFQVGDGPVRGIGGQPPDPRAFPRGCRFAPRCAHARNSCTTSAMAEVDARAGAAATRHDTQCIRVGELELGLERAL
jgi:oligopeptide/dipeptide ABC transporter ATP-binding protein